MSKTKTINNDEAVSAYIANIAQIRELCEKLIQKCDDHFDVSPDDVNWGHVGDVSYKAGLLRRVAGETE